MGDFLKKLKEVFLGTVPDTSDVGKVNKTDITKIVRNAVLVAIAAGVSYIVKDLDPEHLGQYQPWIILGGTAILDFINKLVKNNSEA